MGRARAPDGALPVLRRQHVSPAPLGARLHGAPPRARAARRPRAPRGRRRAPRPQSRLARHVSADRPRDVLAGPAPHRPGRRRRDRGPALRLRALPDRPAGPRPDPEPSVAPAHAAGAPSRSREPRPLARRGPRRGRVHAPGPVVRLSRVLRRDHRRGLPRLARAPRDPAAARPPDRARPDRGRGGRGPAPPAGPRVSVRARGDRTRPERHRSPALRGHALVLSGGPGGEPMVRRRHGPLPGAGSGAVPGTPHAGARRRGRPPRRARIRRTGWNRSQGGAAAGRAGSTSRWRSHS